MNVRLFHILLPAAFSATAMAQMQEVQIGLLRDAQVKSAIVMCGRGGASVLVDGRKAGELAASDGLRIEVSGAGLSGRSLSSQFNAKHHITVIPKAGGGTFRLHPANVKLAEREYLGALDVRAQDGRLTLVNETRLEDYVAGVVQSEAGRDQHPEYYKLQSVSCRTYALANLRKHAGEGFELCDGVHCQVYHGRSDLEPVMEAARATRGMVVVDASIRLIHATFHSNCGGETMNAEDLWSRPEPYLRATRDTFCLHGPHARWHRSITRVAWFDYLRKTYGVSTDDRAVAAAVTHFDPSCRELYLGGVYPRIPLEQVRTDWDLRSAFFTIDPEGDSVVFNGRGFGHGVGLCQEGAMSMARDGYGFTDILHHYYTEVHLVDLSSLDFFRDEGE